MFIANLRPQILTNEYILEQIFLSLLKKMPCFIKQGILQFITKVLLQINA